MPIKITEKLLDRLSALLLTVYFLLFIFVFCALSVYLSVIAYSATTGVEFCYVLPEGAELSEGDYVVYTHNGVKQSRLISTFDMEACTDADGD